MDFYYDILRLILDNQIKTKDQLHSAKIKLCRKYQLNHVPSDAEIFENTPGSIYYVVEPMLRTKPMRTISGVAPVAVMTSPADCPHGTCGYCPGGVEFGSAQSYTGHEPAALRAASNDFNPYFQTRSRLEQLEAIGHHTDKIDLIIMGGTFTARDKEYQNCFIGGCFSALNGQSSWDSSHGLAALKKENETAPHRCIGLTIETRPDWCKIPQVDQILNLGGTRVELGVQTVYDDVLIDVKRGHSVDDSIQATRILKDSGLKVCYHLMPGLPKVSEEMDKSAFDQIFSNPDFRPDMLKIYPTLVVKGTELYKQWKTGDYEPLTTDRAVELLVHLKTIVPPWVRIQRIQRDIPLKLIEAGVDKSNLRQLVNRKLKKQNKCCGCIRCREVGHLSLKGIEPEYDKIKLKTIEYEASGGEEVFMSYEDVKNDVLIGFVRLRLTSENAHRPEIDKETDPSGKPRSNSSIIRELKVFGPMVSFDQGINDNIHFDGKSDNNNTRIPEWQHRGYGQLLIEACERYSLERWDVKKLLVMSGVGVKRYYEKFGYEKDGVYMSKILM
jgi:elongator complex protein 3